MNYSTLNIDLLQVPAKSRNGRIYNNSNGIGSYLTTANINNSSNFNTDSNKYSIKLLSEYSDSKYLINQDEYDFLKVQRSGGSDTAFTILKIQAPQANPMEATVSLMNDSGNGNWSFFDIAQMQYSDAQQLSFRERFEGNHAAKPVVFEFHSVTNGLPVTPVLKIKPSRNVESGYFNKSVDAFGSGGSGWGFNYENDKYTLEVDNLRVRNSMTVNELVLNKIRATNGSLFVTEACRVRSGLTFDGESYFFIPEDDVYFAIGDIIKCQTFTNAHIETIVYKVVYIWHPDTDKHIVVTNLDGSLPTERNIEGKTFVRIGNTTNGNRQGGIFLTSTNNNPYIQVYDNVNTDTIAWSNTRVLLGKLDGQTMSDGTPMYGYGLYTQNGYFEGSVIAWAGSIAGWQILNDRIIKEAGTNSVGLVAGADDMAIYAGATWANRWDAPFQVRKNGTTIMNSATIRTNNGTGKRVEIDAANNTISFKNASNYTTLVLDGDTSTSPTNYSNVSLLDMLDATHVHTSAQLYPSSLTLNNTTNSNKIEFDVEGNTYGGLTSIIIKNLPPTSNYTNANWKQLYVDINTGRVARQI